MLLVQMIADSSALCGITTNHGCYVVACVNGDGRWLSNLGYLCTLINTIKNDLVRQEKECCTPNEVIYAVCMIIAFVFCAVRI